jgi:hypothetical protein
VLAIPAPAVQRTRPEAPREGLLAEVAAGATVLCAHPQALRLVGADIMCSLLYGMQPGALHPSRAQRR